MPSHSYDLSYLGNLKLCAYVLTFFADLTSKGKLIILFLGIIMEVPVTSLTNQITRQAGFQQEANFFTSTNFSLRTREGDNVSFSLNNQSSFSESGQKTQFADGAVVSEFSAVAQAASQFSLKIQGDLNKEEQVAIQALVDKVSPIAQSFFNSPNDFDIGGASASLAESLGVIGEINLSLERTVSVSVDFASQEAVGELEGPPEDSTEGTANETVNETTNQTTATSDSGIRDIPGLVQAVVDSVLRTGEFGFSGEEGFTQSFNDLKQLLSSILQTALDPLNHPAVEEFPKESQLTTPVDDTSQTNPESNPPANRLEPVTI